jgi:hypothetical protein
LSNRRTLARLMARADVIAPAEPCKAIDTADNYCRTCRDYLAECRTAVLAMLDRLPYLTPTQAPHFRNRHLTRAEQLEQHAHLDALLTEVEART